MENNTLKSGSQLKNGEYSIVRVLGQGGFGITYEGQQNNLKRRVAIKEFFMKDSCQRDEDSSKVTVPTVSNRELVERFKQKFIREAQMIAGFDNEHIVRIYDVFEENGTAYYVMEHLGGGSLSDIVKSKGALSESVALGYIRQIADALKYLHEQNTLHLDIKPANILLNQKVQLKLIDFGISKHYDEAGSQTSSSPVGISKGYAPLEQYQQGGDVSKFTPATDIYALGATLYYLVTGTVPPDASEVNEEGLPTLPSKLSDNLKDAITKAMSPRKKDRPQSVEAFLGLLEVNTISEGTKAEKGDKIRVEETVIIDAPKPTPEPAPDPVPAPAPKRKFPKWLWGVVPAAVVIIFCIFFLPNRKTDAPVVLEKPTTCTIAGHEWVDLGLPSGLKWATCNVGASKPEDYGDYFAWGETKTKSKYDWTTYKWCNGSVISITKYNTCDIYGKTDYKDKLALSDDAARQNWGSTWRMPTKQEFEELKANCTEEWTTQNGHNGRKFTSKKNGNCIFLPAAGFTTHQNGKDSFGFYWSSSLDVDDPQSAWCFASSSYGSETSKALGIRYQGQSVRPVTE